MKFSAGKTVKNNLSASKKSKDLLDEIANYEALVKNNSPQKPPPSVRVDYWQIEKWFNISRGRDSLTLVCSKLTDAGYDITKIVYGDGTYPIISSCPRLNAFVEQKKAEAQLLIDQQKLEALRIRWNAAAKNDNQVKMEWTRKSAQNLQSYFEQNKMLAEVGLIKTPLQIKIIYDKNILPDVVVPLLIFEGIEYIDSNTGATIEF